MSPEDKDMFDDYFELFNHPGWKRLMVDLQNNLEAVDTLRGVADEKMLYRNQGKVEVLENLIHLKVYIENLYEDMTKEENPDEDL